MKQSIYTVLKRAMIPYVITRLFVIGLVLLGCSATFAQLNIPLTNCQNLAGTYTDLGTNGSVITTPNFDDANSAATNIGFTFNFNGIAFTQFVLNTNGFIRLGSSPPSSSALFFAGAQSYTGGPFASTNPADVNLIAALNLDLTGGTNPEFRVHTSGTAPNRKCIIQYKNMRDKTVTPPEQFASINFQIHLYEGSNMIEIVYGDFIPTANADNWKSATVGLKGSGMSTSQMITIGKGSTAFFSVAAFNAGIYTAGAFNIRNNVLPDPGRTFRFVQMTQNDRAVMEVYTLGKAPIPFGNPQTIQAWIKNGGSLAQTAAGCTLSITGANTFTNVQTVPALLPGDSILISFAAFSPTNTGLNNITVTLPSDDNLFNNSVSKILETNLNTYSYAQGSLPAGGVGFNNATGDFVAKFTTASSQSINQVDVQFANGGQPFQLGIWSAAINGQPGTLLHSTSTNISTTGLYTVLINPPVSIPMGDFFVGVRQVGSTNVSFAYQPEIPIRPGHFYYTSPSGGTNWNDFAPNNFFRFMIEPKFALQNDVGVLSATPSTGTTLVAGGTYDLTAEVVNYGLTAQNNIPVRYTINNGTPVGPVNTTTSINQNGTTTLQFTGTSGFNPMTPGTYTIRFFTELTGDLNTQNDTLVVVYQVIPAPVTTIPYMQTFTTPQHWTISGVSSLWLTGLATGATGQANDTAMFADFYSTLANNHAMLKSPAFNISALSYPALQFDVAYRTGTIQNDSLQIFVSTDGGVSFVPGSPPVYLKSTYSTPSLITLPPDTADFIPGATTHWRKETVSLEQFQGSQNLMLAFKASSANGNNCWIDNVHLFNGMPPSLTTTPATGITTTTATSGGDVTAMGTSTVTARGVCWSTSPNPTVADPKTTNGNGIGMFSSNITGLTPNTTYYLRAYATNGIGTAYGNEISFSTLAPSTPPTVITSPVTLISHSGATVGGEVTADGGEPVLARGVCYAVNPGPTTSDMFTLEGTGTGVFSSTLTGLLDNTVYYVRAYATNMVGISYGAEETFTTLIDNIEEPESERFTIFMNKHSMMISASHHTTFDMIQLIDMQGKVAASFAQVQCLPAAHIMFPEIASGTYVVTLIEGDLIRQVKVVVP
jgi:hypothetical protein